MSSEFERIARLEARFRRASPELRLGIGDDCAVLHPSAHPRVWTIDSAVEGVHFSRAFMALSAIGFRSFMAAASDVAAMGGRAIAALSALTLPRALDDRDLDALVEGIAAAADACVCPVSGGNLARGGELSLTTSVLGECSGPVLTRAGARVGDGIFVSGPVGGAALGLLALQSGQASAPLFAAAVERFLAPRARLDLAAQIAACASAAIDLSDGLTQDLGHLCRASGVGATIVLEAVPLLPRFMEAARALGRAPHDLALAGGEDYELLFTAPPAAVPHGLATQVGEIVAADAGVQVVDAQGSKLALLAGFDHFADS